MLKKKIKNSNFTKITKPLFPIIHSHLHAKKGYATLSIGGNIDDTLRRFDRLIILLQKSSFISLVATSPILKNPPFGYLEQAYFYNAIIIIQTNLEPKKLMRYLLKIEKKLGRKRTFQNAPRKIDIDMLRYDDRIIRTKFLTIPYEKAMNRESVIIPIYWMKRGF
ncbi:MAG: 2-amino-4-hydroxy-6-hydroxymethyldihydropteridine diphosphokinase [Campylobacterales bacterium]|nr:2-amino-4-hydroxy-6-hydroxymethyldihydropteridine diphosphokinase [Campylobacterales bacterium]